MEQKPQVDIDVSGIKYVVEEGRYYVIAQQRFVQEDWGTDAWEQQFVASAVHYLSAHITQIDQVYERYQEFENVT